MVVMGMINRITIIVVIPNCITHNGNVETLRFLARSNVILQFKMNVYCILKCCGLDGPGIESRWGEIIHTRPDRPWGPPNLLYKGYRVFPVGKSAGAWCRPSTFV
jgi:hypothetical protein